MDEFEKAILLQFEVNNPNSINATQALEKFKESPNCWKECLNRLFNSQNDRVLFFCLQVIQEFILHRHFFPNIFLFLFSYKFIIFFFSQIPSH